MNIYFQPLGDNSYLIKCDNTILFNKSKESYITALEDYKLSDYKKWFLKRLDNNVIK